MLQLKSIHELRLDSQRRFKQVLYRVSGRQFVHFLHIGKTAGTAVKESVGANSLTKKYKIYVHGHRFKLKDVPKGDKVVFFLRDPISRCVSGFYGRKRQDRPKYNSPWRPNEEISFNRFSTAEDLALALSSEDQELREAASYAMKNIGHVKSSYWDWFDNEEYFLSRLSDVLFIGFQETLEHDFATLRNILYLPETVQLPKDDVKAHRSPEGVKPQLSEVARQNLREWYAEDYKFFELCKSLYQEKFKP
jgi:Sulfotransferase family